MRQRGVLILANVINKSPFSLADYSGATEGDQATAQEGSFGSSEEEVCL